MPDDYVTLPPMKREQVEKLAALCEREGRPGSPGVSPFVAEILASAAPLLRSALEEPPVCTTFDCNEPAVASAYVAENEPPSWCRYCEDCAAILERGGRQVKWDVERGEVSREYRVVYDHGRFNARIQHRTVAETPWRDLEEGERDG